jgi:hypothetical protein
VSPPVVTVTLPRLTVSGASTAAKSIVSLPSPGFSTMVSVPNKSKKE